MASARAIVAAVLVGAVAREAAAQDKTLSVSIGADAPVVLVLVPAGTNRHGAPLTDPLRAIDELERDVTISKPFYIGKLPVTRGQYDRFVAETGYRTEAEKGTSGGSGWDGKELVQKKEFNWRNPGFAQTGDHPVTLVTFDDSMAFASWLSKKAGRVVTLPTEAQWEHACRAGTKSRFCGAAEEKALADVAWFKTNAGNGTRPAGTRKANAWGVFDMSGEVWEWTRDWYGPVPLGGTDPEQTNQNLSDKPRRVLKGGSWLKDQKNARAAMRYKNTPGSRNADNGFRVVASVEAGGVPPATPAGTPTPPTGTPTTKPGGDDGTTGLIVGGIFLVVTLGCAGIALALLVFVIVRSMSKRRAAAGGLEGLKTWSQGDGFFILAPHVARGARVRYRCSVAGQVRQAALTYDCSPRGQFVYTGGHPTNVIIEGVDPPAAGGWAAAGAASQYDDDYNDPSPPFRGYPSAY